MGDLRDQFGSCQSGTEMCSCWSDLGLNFCRRACLMSESNVLGDIFTCIILVAFGEFRALVGTSCRYLGLT
jgi:hypothetical protein